jgi:hypothetical protein
LVGALLGWQLAGTVLSAISFVVWASLGAWLFGEQPLARVLWVALRLLEFLWRSLPFILLLASAALVWWLVK